MDNNMIRQNIVKIMKDNGATSEQIAKVEIAIMYLSDQDFRKKLENFVFDAACRIR